MYFVLLQKGHLRITEAIQRKFRGTKKSSENHPYPKISMLTGSSSAAPSKEEAGSIKSIEVTEKSAEKVAENKQLLSAQVEIPDEKDARFCVLSYEQVRRLNDLMSEVINIHGRGNFPTIDVRLSDLVSVVKSKLDADGVKVHEIRLNGSGASSVLSPSDISYNDLDLIFSVDLSTAKAFERVKGAVLESLMELLPEGVSRKRMSSCSLKEAYVSKMVKVNDSGDRWSLISLGMTVLQHCERSEQLFLFFCLFLDDFCPFLCSEVNVES